MPAAWSSWLPDLLPQLPGCPDVIAEHEVKRAAQEFFERSRAWAVTLDAENVLAGELEMTLSPNSGQEIVAVRQVWLNDNELSPETADCLSEEMSASWQSHTGVPAAYLQNSPSSIRFYPVPDARATVTVRVAVKPSESAKNIPDEIASRFRNTIAQGAKGRLMLYVGQPWSNPEFGVKFEAAFNEAIDKARYKSATNDGKARIPSRVRWV